MKLELEAGRRAEVGEECVVSTTLLTLALTGGEQENKLEILVFCFAKLEGQKCHTVRSQSL